MGRKEDESSIDFRKRILDQVSPTFCAAKWFNATIWLGSGQTASCHHPPPHKINLSEVKDNPTAIHNTFHKKLMRSQMLRGEKPRECEYCWKIEGIQRDNASDRIFKSDFYPDELLLGVKDLKWDEDVPLKTLELAFDRICNFACSYCNAGYSTKWAQELKKNGPYQNMVSDANGAYQHHGAWAEKYKTDEENPYLEAFWKWWPELSETLMELKITGGEPLMSPQLWKLFDYFENRESREDFLFSFNSNLGAKTEVIQKMLEKTKNIKRLGIYTSMEATGAHAEYVRDGLDYELWKKNVETILETKRLDRFVIMSTVNIMSLYSFTDFMDQCLEWKSKYGKYLPSVAITILRWPSFMSATVLPDELKQERYDHLKAWFDKNKDNPLLTNFEVDTFQRLLDYIEVIKIPHDRTSEMESRLQDFKTFHRQYDKRRGKSFENTFPKILVDWYNSLPSIEINRPEKWISGDASENYHKIGDLKQLAKKVNANTPPEWGDE